MATPIGCYVHIPFCVKKCAYCDFNSHSGYTERHIRTYVGALEQEIRSAEPKTPVDTIFFGGGTPTAIPAGDETALLSAIFETVDVTPDAEITTEANPGTIDVAHLDVLRATGFNRISFGVQSFDAGLLATLDRIHSAQEAKQAVAAARAAGFENVSIDLMFSLPNQTIAQWRDTLDQAMELDTQHVSLYSLIVEEGTGFYTLQQKGRLPLPDDDTAADMYQMAIDRAQAAGYQQYEISNFARPGRECRHNLHYWRNEPYFGFGCGAVSYLNGARRMNVKSPARYADAVAHGADLTLSCEELALDDTISETMMLGFRLTQEGIDCDRFERRFGMDPRSRYAEELERYERRGLLEITGERIRLTAQGVFLANEVMAEFV